MEFRVLQANHGDALLISWEHEGKVRNLLMDGGTTATYKSGHQKGDLYEALEGIRRQGERVDLLILSHVDDDHIGGVLAGFKNDGLLAKLTDMVWFNSGILVDQAFKQSIDETHYLDCGSVQTGTDADNLTSIGQGVRFEEIVKEREIWDEKLVETAQVYEFYGAKISILSPSRDQLKKLLRKWEKIAPNPNTSGVLGNYSPSFFDLLAKDQFQADTSDMNGSSIALLFELDEKQLLLLGDAHEEVIVNSILQLKDQFDVPFSKDNPLPVDYVKLSHHGSARNTSPEFLNLVKCQNFIVSTNGNRHGHPDKLTLARIARHHPKSTIWFNYRNICGCITRKLSTDDAEQIKCEFKSSREGFQL